MVLDASGGGGGFLDESASKGTPSPTRARRRARRPGLIVNEFSRAKQARIQEWRDTYERWPREWADGSIESSNHLRLTAAEFAQLGEEIDTLITGWVERTRDRQVDALVDVEVQWYSFPVGDPPADEDQ